MDEAAESISFSRRSFYRAIAAGELQVFKFGKMSRIRAEDVDAFIERHMMKAGGVR
ncbi:MAG: helix-turn-helix domain-containing protein [Kiritimatiellales bacterium]